MLLSRRNNLFDEFFNDPFFNDSVQTRTTLMRTDIEDDGTNYIIDVELPGYKKENVRAELKDGYLTIFAEASGSSEDSESRNFLRKERYSGSMSRSFYVGEGVTQDDVHAKFEDGILRLSLPKKDVKISSKRTTTLQIEG